MWLPALWLKQQMDQQWNNKRMDMIPRYPPFSDSSLLSNWQQHASHIWRKPLLRFSRITLTPGVKMRLQYTHLNWIYPHPPKPQQIVAHICCHFPFWQSLRWRNNEFKAWATVCMPSMLPIKFSAGWKRSSTQLKDCLTVALGSNTVLL